MRATSEIECYDRGFCAGIEACLGRVKRIKGQLEKTRQGRDAALVIAAVSAAVTIFATMISLLMLYRAS